MGPGISFVSRALCIAFFAVVPGVVDVHPTILGCFIAPDVIRDVLAV